MPSLSRRTRDGVGRALAIAVSVVLVASVGGCATPGAKPESVALSAQQGWPEAKAPGPPPLIDTYPTPPVGWLAQEGDRFWLVTWGSGSCVFDATEVEEVDAFTVAVRFEQAPAEGCTDDLSPRAHELAVPDGLVGQLETAEVVLVENAFAHVGGEVSQTEWTVDLVGGWFQSIAESFESGLAYGMPMPPPAYEQFAPRVLARGPGEPVTLVTYGSSSCPLLPIAAAVEGDVLAITVRERPAGACTADIAPTTSRLPPVDGFDPDVIASARVTIERSVGGGEVVTVPVERLD
ncbi:hypothetical protein GCM10009792_25430 [Microcella alkalica]